ncbi:hypothetical protein PRIPAC_83085 [Pristionchus pacificus]|uniref:Uncharacterized protein n=1 Tax=Pristionchus pacificus TaxID=54126 RepID=A0A2A6CCE3_PRIPA|nr:hypothetical protein PRIPAC_83085 [Pristionchus pacificus]|eukprot:PDM75767.1 hypothetical protein PRIPAC_40146 [Pristionchus pacificus]
MVDRSGGGGEEGGLLKDSTTWTRMQHEIASRPTSMAAENQLYPSSPRTTMMHLHTRFPSLTTRSTRNPLISRVIAHAPITAPELFPPNWFGGVVV